MIAISPALHFVRRQVLGAVLVMSGGLFPAATSASQINLVDDDFDAGSRADWFNSSTALGLSASTNALVSTSGSPTLVRYFPLQTLAVGESLILSFTLSATGLSDKLYGFRLGLMRSGSKRVSTDDFGATVSFADYQGYRLVTNLGSSAASSTVFQKRNDTSTSSLLGGTWSKVGNSTVGVNFSSGTTYPFVLTLTRIDGASLAMSVSINGVVLLSAVDNAATALAFDTIAVFKDSSAAESLTFDNVSLAYGKSVSPAH
ncbi:MAG: hypothetical protein WC205_11740 [Opitutaceae bacterium]|jgi:hypothetical protein